MVDRPTDAPAQPEPLDPDAVRSIAEDLIRAVHEHYERRPEAGSTVLEVLNALAVVAGKVIEGTGHSDCAVQFFITALNQQIGAEGETLQ